MSLVTTCPNCGTVFRMVREQLNASEGWVRCGHCMDVFDARLPLKEDDETGEKMLSDSFDSQHAALPVSELSFVQQAQKKVFWSSPWVRNLLLALSCGLVLLLWVQLVRTQREWFSQSSAYVNTSAQWLCEQISCTAEPRRQLDQWRIENASFEREGSTFRLQLQLKSTTTIALLTPHLELSLMDVSDQVLVRQVLSLQNALPPAPTSSSLAEQKFSFLITPTPSRNDIAGYRLVLFYP